MRKPWTIEERATLRRLWGKTPMEQVYKAFPGRSYSSLEKQARIHKLSRIREVGKAWSDTEVAIIIQMWTSRKPRTDIERALPGRSWHAIVYKAKMLRLDRVKTEYPIVPGKVLADISIPGQKFRFGVVSDTHLGSKYAQITYLRQIYERFQADKCQAIFHAGDITEGSGGHYKGQRQEIHIHGADEMVDFVAKNYPKAPKGCKTYIVEGYHDLDYYVEGGNDIIKKIAQKREDIEVLGHAVATYILPIAGTKIKFDIVHPGGGTAYAISYRMQKIVEGYSSENKPHVLIVGHFHKAEFMPVLRNVLGIQAGCFQAQTPFAKRKGLAFHYGGWIVDLEVDKKGTVAIKTQFIPFYVAIENDYKRYI